MAKRVLRIWSVSGGSKLACGPVGVKLYVNDACASNGGGGEALG